MRIVLLLLVLVEFIVFRKAKPWARLSFWIVGGFVFAYLFSRRMQVWQMLTLCQMGLPVVPTFERRHVWG
jgi:hypothetical protein